MQKSQIKSKERVADHGEVFTNEREVNAMLDLVKDESYNIESTFLEPACGDGNFLAAILKRKLEAVDKKYGKARKDYEVFSLVALSSIYGVELLNDNREACIDRLFKIYCAEYEKHLKSEKDFRVEESAHYILEKNILCGDALTLLKSDGTPIVFAEWKLVTETKFKRRDYELAKILDAESYNDEISDYGGEQLSIFGITDESNKKDIYDSINKPVKDYPLIDYRELKQYE